MTVFADQIIQPRQSEGRGAPAGANATRRGPRAFAIYVLALLCLISLLGYYDRYLVAILVEAIKHDLKVSDGEIGLLTGFAFALVYSVFAVPVARYSDGGRRVFTLGASLVVWSAMTALCGIAPNYAVLLAARLGVGMGEAGCIPSIHALVTEYFSGRWRTIALTSTVVVGGVGFMIANGVGGWLADHWGWRAAFLVGAAPGPLLAVLLFASVREPAAPTTREDVMLQTMGSAVRLLLRRRSYALLCAGVALATVASSATLSWIPAFLMRNYALSAGQVGTGYGLVLGISTVAALLSGGILSDTMTRRDARWGIWLPALSFAMTMPFTLAFLFAPDLRTALLIAAPMTFLGALCTTPAYALVQRLAGPDHRATATALYLLIVNLLGMGTGPALCGWISDLLTASFGRASLQYALAVVSFAYLAGAALITAGARHVARDEEAANRA